MYDRLSSISFLLILFTSTSICQDEESPPLLIEPFRLTIEVGTDADFSCILTDPDEEATHRISWFYPDGVTEIGSQPNSSHIYVDVDSKLHVIGAQENDTGSYLCMAVVDHSNGTLSNRNVLLASATGNDTTSTSTEPWNSATSAASHLDVTGTSTAGVSGDRVETYNATVYLKVYVMPTYFTEGMIILAINVGLLIVFIACLIQSLITEKKRMQIYQNKY